MMLLPRKGQKLKRLIGWSVVDGQHSGAGGGPVHFLGPEQFESAYQHWLNHWKANDAYSPQVEANMIDVMGEAVEKLYAALADAGFDVLSRLGPR
jgi:hypothetical protein